MQILPLANLLVVAAALSGAAAIAHVGIVIFGGDWYRFFGAGEELASMAERGHWYPVVITLAIACLLSVWAVYALSGAGLIRKLPLLRPALVLISGIYLLRGLAGFPMAFLAPGENSVSFWLWSSAICLGFGLVYAMGLRQVWPRLTRGHA